MSEQLCYWLVIEGNFGPDKEEIRSIRVALGEHKGWADEYRKELEAADRISLVPKDGTKMPVVTAVLDGNKRWVAFWRVHGSLTHGGGKRVVVYAIGWQVTVRGRNIKSLTWVYPNGNIENAQEPSFWEQFM